MSGRADEIMERMGFPVSETGPYVSALREQVRRQVQEDGLICRSGGTWAGLNIPHEVRARELLAMEWAVKRGHRYRVKAIDGLYTRWRNVKTGKRGIRIHWAWFGDRARESVMHARVFWDKRILRLRNPYEVRP